MKRYLIIYVFLAFLAFSSFHSCKEAIQDFGEVEFIDGDRAIVKINMASAYPDDRYMYVKVNDVRVTPLIRGREPYPGGGYNTRGPSGSEFLMIDAGNVNVKVCLPHKTDNGKDSVILYSTDVSVKGGERYTFHVTDTGTYTKVIPTIEEFAQPDSAYASYRFINLMPNVEALDFYYGYFNNTAGGQIATQDSLIASNIKFGEISSKIVLHRSATKTFKIRPAGAPVTNESVLAFYGNAGASLNQRQYTGYAMGYAGETSAAMKPYISFMLVR